MIAQVYCKASCQNKCQQHRKYRKALRFLNDAANQLKVFLIPLQTLSQNDPQEGSKGNTGIERARSELAIEIVLNWLKTLAHSIALKQLLVGFDIDLYERSEFIMIYWYCERLLAAFIAIVQEWNAQLGRMNDISKKQSKGKKQRKELKKKIEEEKQKKPREVDQAKIDELRAKISDANTKILAAFDEDDDEAEEAATAEVAALTKQLNELTGGSSIPKKKLEDAKNKDASINK